MTEPKKRGGFRAGAGRPPKGDVTIHCSMPLGLVGRVDAWRSKRGLVHSRPEAIRALIGEALDQAEANEKKES